MPAESTSASRRRFSAIGFKLWQGTAAGRKWTPGSALTLTNLRSIQSAAAWPDKDDSQIKRAL